MATDVRHHIPAIRTRFVGADGAEEDLVVLPQAAPTLDLAAEAMANTLSPRGRVSGVIVATLGPANKQGLLALAWPPQVLAWPANGVRRMDWKPSCQQKRKGFQ